MSIPDPVPLKPHPLCPKVVAHFSPHSSSMLRPIPFPWQQLPLVTPSIPIPVLPFLFSWPRTSLIPGGRFSSKTQHQQAGFRGLFPSPRFSLDRRAEGAKMSIAELESSLVVKKKGSEILEDLKGTSIFLVGMNCTMKTNIGKLLADALRYCYFDSDSLIEQAVGGESAAKSFLEKDENGFRDSESEVLKQLSSMGRLVVCAGDGAVQTSTNLAFLRHGISIWIDVPLDSLANEILTAQAPSPAGQGTSELDSFSQVLEELLKRYNELKGGYATADASVTVQKVATELGYEDLASVTPEDMALEALKVMEKLTRVMKMMEAAGKPF